MKPKHAVLLLLSLGLVSGLTGCVGSPQMSSPPGQPMNPSILFLIAPPSSLAINASATLSAAVTNDPSNPSIAWSVTCGSAGACGSISPSQTFNEGNTTYTAPGAIPAGTTVTVTASIVGDASYSISAKITITPPQPIVVSFEGVPPASLQIKATAQLNAKITNDISANPQVKWTVACGSSGCGSFNPVTTTSEASTTYTAPATIPSGNSVTVTAISMTDPTKSVSATIAITKLAPTLANGTYVFQVSGPVGPAANFVAGVMVAQNGAITGGEQDFVNYGFDQNDGEYLPLFDSNLTGSYATTPDGDLQITLQTGDSNIGTETLTGVMISSSRVLLTEVDGSIGNGTLELQTSKAAPAGGYAFSTFGVDVNGQPAGIGGILNVDRPGGISGMGSVVDINDNFTFSAAQSLAPSTVSSPDTYGRVVFQLMPSTPSGFPSFYLAGYIVDATQIRLVETMGDNFQGVMGGMALSQGTSTGTFSTISLAGLNYVFGAAGDTTNGLLQIAGVFTANADGSLAGTLNWNDLSGTTVQNPRGFTGSYGVEPSGRVSLSNITDGSTFTYDWEFYLAGNGEGLLLSSENQNMTAGRGLQQQTGALTAASLSRTYGLSALMEGNVGQLGANAAIGQLTSTPGTGSDALTGFLDFGDGGTDSPLSGNVTAGSNGVFTGTITGLNPGSYTTQGNFALYLIDNTRAVIIETDNKQLTLGHLELQ